MERVRISWLLIWCSDKTSHVSNFQGPAGGGEEERKEGKKDGEKLFLDKQNRQPEKKPA